MTVRIITGDARDELQKLETESVNCVVTSPPYFGLRDYGVTGQMGLEETPAEYIAAMVGVFQLVWRVLRDDGVLWLNLGDSYANDGKWGGSTGGKHAKSLHGARGPGRERRRTGLKPKNLMMIPARVALALQADGWYLRKDIIWVKPNPMPESVADRPTSSHEHIFMLTKSERYWYDGDAVREAANGSGSDSRNLRDVWNIPTRPFSEAHFATFPTEIPERCIKASCPAGGVVLDPFGGAGTTSLVADRFGLDAILIELNPAYAEIARRRIEDDAVLFAEVSA
jgi:DNA modification methylase